MTYLCYRKHSLPTGHHFIPFVVQHVHETIRLIATHKLGHITGERRALGQSYTIACGGKGITCKYIQYSEGNSLRKMLKRLYFLDKPQLYLAKRHMPSGKKDLQLYSASLGFRCVQISLLYYSLFLYLCKETKL